MQPQRTGSSANHPSIHHSDKQLYKHYQDPTIKSLLAALANVKSTHAVHNTGFNTGTEPNSGG